MVSMNLALARLLSATEYGFICEDIELFIIFWLERLIELIGS